MKNDFHLFTHTPVFLTKDAAVGQSTQSPDFQVSTKTYIIDNRMTTAPLVVAGLYDELSCEVTTGGESANSLRNQNAACDALVWLPALSSVDAIGEVDRFAPSQRVTFNYQQNLNSVASHIDNIQTAFVGHYHDRALTPPYESIRPYILKSRTVTIPGNGSIDIPLSVDQNCDLLVRAFLVRCPPLGVLINIVNESQQETLTNKPVFADLIAYRTFATPQNFRMPFLPWIAPRKNRYSIEVQNLTREEIVFDFAFWGHLVDYPAGAE